VAVIGRTDTGADIYAVIERDNQLAFNAMLKRITGTMYVRPDAAEAGIEYLLTQ